MFERPSASVGPGAVRPRRPGPPSGLAGGVRRPGPSSASAGGGRHSGPPSESAGGVSRPEPPSGSAGGSGPSASPVWAGQAGPAAPCLAAQGSAQ